MANQNPLKPSRRVTLDEYRSKQQLKSYGIPVTAEIRAADAAQAVAAAEALGYPVVVKGLGSALAHKTEHGLVHLNLWHASAVENAVCQILESGQTDLESLLIQPFHTGTRELMAGMVRDPQFGAVVSLGIGGVLAEAIDDVTFGLVPLTLADARSLLDQLRSRKLLGPFRGEAPIDRDRIAQILVALSDLAQEHPEISEIDINPIKIASDGAPTAVDALVVSQPPLPAPEHLPAVPPEAIAKLFYPRSIAFVGASAQLGKWGYMLPVNTIAGGFQGAVYLVNPKGGQMHGQTVYASIAEIPGKIDLVVVTIPAAKVPDLIAQCKGKRIASMILISSGFSETGPDGSVLEARVMTAARDAGIRILGPNTMGVTNPHAALYCTGSSVRPMAGATAIVSQSGNMGTQLLAFAEKQEVGIRGFCGSGNEAMITMEDYLDGFEIDALTKTVILYVESIKNGRRFFESARRVSRHKPVVLLKGGQTEAGNRAATSHTGAMASDNRIFDAMCRQAGIVKVDRPTELLDLAAAFSSLPLPEGPRIAIMTLGGGWGVVTADLCNHYGLTVPELDPAVMKQLDRLLPDYWSHANPVDLVGASDPELPTRALETLMAWDGCDAVINLGILGRRIFLDRLASAAQAIDPQVGASYFADVRNILDAFEQQFIEQITRLMTRYRKPVVGVHLLTDGTAKMLYRVDGASHKAVFYETPERAVHALSKMAAYRRYKTEQASI